jgi:hypothetical protein
MRYVSLITVFFAGLLTRCASVTPLDQPPPTFADSGSYCEGRAQAECSDQVLLACGTRKELCTPARQTACVNERPLGKTFDSARAEACVNSVAAAYADAKLTKDEITTYNAICALVFDGTGIRNAACQTDGDCAQADGLKCVPGAGSAAGTCQVPRTVQPGGKCDTSDALCADGYYCGPTQYCIIDADTNEACAPATPCKATLKCGAAGKCEPKLLDATACTADGECASGICPAGINVCVSVITLAPNEPFCVGTR